MNEKTLARFIFGSMAFIALLLIFTGCVTNPYIPPPAVDCDPFIDGTFITPPRPNPAWRHTGTLVLGDIKAKKLAARHILKAPPGWDCPDKIDNSAYCTALENQGPNPWCAAYSMGQLLSASYWREFHFRHDFPEDKLYAAAKAIDRNNSEGTTLESIMQAARRMDYGLGYMAAMPEEDEEQVYEVEDVIFAIHKYGLVLVGMQITEGWNKLNPDGTIGPDTKAIGGHGVLVSGYSRSCNLIWGPNWWGKNWGKGGWWMMTLDQFDQQLGYGYALKITWEKIQ